MKAFIKTLGRSLLLALSFACSCESEEKPPPTPPPTKAEVKARLEKEGHILKEGRWYTRKKWEWTLWNLRDVKAPGWTLENVEIKKSWDQVTRRTLLVPGLFDPSTTNPDSLGPKNLRFLAPPEGKGRVTIQVEAPGEILECRVKAAGEIRENDKKGSIQVSVIPPEGKAVVLYRIDRGSNHDYHEVTRTVKGSSTFTIAADIEEIPHVFTRETYFPREPWAMHARFLPTLSHAPHVCVLQAKGVVLAPVPEADQEWARAR